MPDPVITGAVDALASGRSLSADQAAEVLARVMGGEASEVEIAGFLVALRTKGETVEEVAGLARTMRELATPVDAGRDDLLDTAGTGGGRRTFNVSTTAALIAAAAGCAVAKHGNRSATGLSGSADVLEALGVRIDLAPEAVARCIREVGFGFMFAPAHHAATRFVVPVRKELGVRTVFNLLGPLTNPAGATRQLIGVADPAQLELVAGALALLGVERALVVSSDDGLDEMSTAGRTHVVEVTGGAEARIERYVVAPGDVGLPAADPNALAGGTPEHNAEVTRRIFAGEPGPPRDLAALNAGAAIYVAGAADTIAAGVRAAEAALDDGAAAATLERLVAHTRKLAGDAGEHGRPEADRSTRDAGLDAPRR
jgi:anthranilate phosphoribosyltransferase